MTSSSAEPGIDNLNKAFQYPPHTMIYRARDVVIVVQLSVSLKQVLQQEVFGHDRVQSKFQ